MKFLENGTRPQPPTSHLKRIEMYACIYQWKPLYSLTHTRAHTHTHVHTHTHKHIHTRTLSLSLSLSLSVCLFLSLALFFSLSLFLSLLRSLSLALARSLSLTHTHTRTHTHTHTTLNTTKSNFYTKSLSRCTCGYMREHSLCASNECLYTMVVKIEILLSEVARQNEVGFFFFSKSSAVVFWVTEGQSDREIGRWSDTEIAWWRDRVKERLIDSVIER